MKKTLKNVLALLVVFSVVISVFPAVFAAESDFVSSHVVFKTNTYTDEETNETTTTIYAEAFVRNYTSSAENAVLYCAVYDSTDKLVGVNKAEGVNTVLRTKKINLESGQTVKAFVWEKSNQKVISNIATYGANSLTDASLEITFDGVSFKDYIGEDFSWNDTEYTKNLTASNGTVSYPVVTAKLAGYTDNTASVKVVNDFETSKTTKITVEIGQRNETNHATNTKGSVTQKVYTKPVAKTFTITYTEPSTDITVDNSSIKVIKNLAMGEKFSSWTAAARLFSADVSMNSDRGGWSGSQPGGVVSYPEVMELEGTEFIAHAFNLKGDTNISTTGNVLCTFTAGCDAELIYAAAQESSTTLINDGWTAMTAPSENLVFVNSYVNGTPSSRWTWYTKTVKKGATVTIKTNGTTVFPVVFARPIN